MMLNMIDKQGSRRYTACCIADFILADRKAHDQALLAEIKAAGPKKFTGTGPGEPNFFGGRKQGFNEAIDEQRTIVAIVREWGRL